MEQTNGLIIPVEDRNIRRQERGSRKRNNQAPKEEQRDTNVYSGNLRRLPRGKTWGDAGTLYNLERKSEDERREI